MIQLLSSILGSAEITVFGINLPRAVNMLGAAGVSVKNVEKLDSNSFSATVDLVNLKRTKSVLKGYKVKINSKKGIKKFVDNKRKRTALIIGLIVSMALLCVLSQRTFLISVSGCDNKQAEIIQKVKDSGMLDWHFFLGTRIDNAEKSILSDKDIFWANVSVKGCVVRVLVKENTRKILSESDGGNVICKKDCQLENLIVYSGTANKKNGETVSEGDVLIMPYEERLGEQVPTKASGIAMAKVWYYAQECVPLTEKIERFTGKKANVISIGIFGKELAFGKNEFEQYIDNKKNFSLFGFLNFSKTEYRQVETNIIDTDIENTLKYKQKDLFEKLELQVPQNEIVVDRNVIVEDEDDYIRIIAYCQTVEDVAKYG